MNASPQAPDRQPIFNVPMVVLMMVAAFVAVHLVRLWVLSDEADVRLVYDYALIPARWSVAFLAHGADAVVNALPPPGNAGSAWPRYVAARIMQDQQAGLWTALTYAFLHGSWTHLIFNSVWFVTFGAPLARRWGALAFLGFCVVTALAGAFTYYLVEPYSVIPTIGASGIVSGLFGAAPWYAFERGFGFGQQERWQPRLTFAGIMRNRTALVFIIFWLLTAFVTAVIPDLMTGEAVTIAWQAHLGGFLAAFLLFPLADDHIPKA